MKKTLKTLLSLSGIFVTSNVVSCTKNAYTISTNETVESYKNTGDDIDTLLTLTAKQITEANDTDLDHSLPLAIDSSVLEENDISIKEFSSYFSTLQDVLDLSSSYYYIDTPTAGTNFYWMFILGLDEDVVLSPVDKGETSISGMIKTYSITIEEVDSQYQISFNQVF